MRRFPEWMAFAKTFCVRSEVDHVHTRSILSVQDRDAVRKSSLLDIDVDGAIL